MCVCVCLTESPGSFCRRVGNGKCSEWWVCVVVGEGQTRNRSKLFGVLSVWERYKEGQTHLIGWVSCVISWWVETVFIFFFFFKSLPLLNYSVSFFTSLLAIFFCCVPFFRILYLGSIICLQIFFLVRKVTRLKLYINNLFSY